MCGAGARSRADDDASVLAAVAWTLVAEKQARKDSPALPNCSCGPLRTVMLVSAAA